MKTFVIHHILSHIVAMQDYGHVHGHKIWQEEFTQVLSHNIDLVCGMSLEPLLFSYLYFFLYLIFL